MSDAVRQKEADVLVAVRAKPRARQTRVTGRRDGAIEIALRAPPTDGAANDALVAFVAKKLGVAKSRVALQRGHTSRQKLLRVLDVSAEDVEHALGE